MPTFCIQCALRAFVSGKETPLFEEEHKEHMRLFHPDPVETERERQHLEREALRLARAGLTLVRGSVTEAGEERRRKRGTERT